MQNETMHFCGLLLVLELFQVLYSSSLNKNLSENQLFAIEERAEDNFFNIRNCLTEDESSHFHSTCSYS